jgi:hypothetical protein
MALLRLATFALLTLACAAPKPPVANRERMEAVFADRGAFRLELEGKCKNLERADQIIGDAIEIGAPIYNTGSAIGVVGCFRIYEGAAYKLLVETGDECPDLAAFMRAGMMEVDSREDASDKAWALRQLFDTIGGRSTRYQR